MKGWMDERVFNFLIPNLSVAGFSLGNTGNCMSANFVATQCPPSASAPATANQALPFYQDALAPPPPDIPPPPQELPLQELLVQELPLCGKPVAKTCPKPLRNLPFLPPFIGRSIKIKMMITKIINGEK